MVLELLLELGIGLGLELTTPLLKLEEIAALDVELKLLKLELTQVVPNVSNKFGSKSIIKY